jgi:choline dehydrogenase-like flavoprotein
MKHPFAYIQSALMYSRFGISWRPYAQIRLTVMCEQLATDESLIELDHDNLDAFGVPKMRLTWKIGREPWRAAQCISRQVKAILEASLPCEVFLRPELTATSEDFDSSVFTSVNHHMGGAVMGIEPTRSVVNPQLRLHDFENIWVCSASTFPTGSHSNPTLTVLALGGRLVDHLSSKNKAK